MNIAILTQPICNNYGGILQNYALQTVLERQGHTVTTLNFPVISGYSGSKVRHILSTCRRVLVHNRPDRVLLPVRVYCRLCRVQNRTICSIQH